MASLIVVCTGNICRSPVGEGVLRHFLAGTVEVTSAGTHAMSGHPAAPEAIEFVGRTIEQDLDHTARQLTRDQSESADLVIAMTAEHRAWIARSAPRAVRRTFTLKELDQLLGMLPADASFATLKELTLAVSRLRPRLAATATYLDIADPYGGPPEGYESSFGEVLDSSRRVAEAITNRLRSA